MGMDNQLRLDACMRAPAPPLTELSNDAWLSFVSGVKGMALAAAGEKIKRIRIKIWGYKLCILAVWIFRPPPPLTLPSGGALPRQIASYVRAYI